MSLKRIVKHDAFFIAAGAVLLALAILLEQLPRGYIAIALYILALLVSGGRVMLGAIRGILRRDVFDEKLLMSIASIGAMIIGEYTEAVAVMLFFLIGESFERRAVRRSRASIRALMDICPDEARVLRDGEEETVEPDEVEIGETIIVRTGERVPIDCTVISGSADVDTSSMTGESMPISVREGSHLDSGYVVIRGLLRCVTEREAGDSAAARVLALVELASDNKSREEQFITKFSRYYTPAVVIAALLLATVPSLVGVTEWSDSVYRALTFLVISCPCALVISVPMAFFGGIGGAASRGILYKGGNVFSAVARTETVAFDKTGTVTSGEFRVIGTTAVGITDDELLSLAATAEYASNHPIAACIRAATESACAPDSATEIAGEGVICESDGSSIAVGNFALMKRVGATLPSDISGDGAVLVARDGTLVGAIYVSDSVKSGAKDAVSRLSSLGVRSTVMLSGDRRERVESVCREVGISRAEYELTPEAKYNALRDIIADSRGRVMYVGDGINDAPALALAHVGVSMGKIGQDSAIEASDVVIMTDDLAKIPEAIIIARRTISIAKQNIVFALSVKGAILLLGALGFANMWLAVFADVGVAVLAILNSMRALKYRNK